MPTKPPVKPHAAQPTSQWPSIIEKHVASYKAGEKKAWDKNQAFFLGNPWANTQVGESEALLDKTSTNFVLPLVETAQANILPPNPRVTLNARTPANRDQMEQGATIVNYFLQQGKWRKETAIGIYNVVMCGRCPFKTTWDFDADRAITRFIDPRNYFFDRTAQRFEDMKYEIEATLLTRRQMERKIEEGVYPSWAIDKQSAEQYPTWLVPGDKQEVNGLRNFASWFMVYEVYDREAGIVFHYLPNDRRPILTDDLIFRPYDLLTFTYNGTDCGGVSEVSLIMSNQEEYNWSQTYELNRQRFDIPVDYFDARTSTTDKEDKNAAVVKLGSKVPITPHGDKTVAQSFYRPPPLSPHPLAQQNLGHMRESMAYVSALSDSQRGQTIGAKTATEMEWIKQQIRDRLGPRIANVDELTESVAAKMFFLAQRYMREEKVVQLIGEKEWKTVNPFTLEGVDATFDIVAYNPLRMNPAVRIEALRNLQPLVVGNPYVKQRPFLEMLFRDIQAGEPGDMLYTDEEVAARAAPPAPTPGAPPDPGAPAPALSTPLDPGAPPAEIPATGSMPPGALP
jgi:hypothetical protein